MPSNTPKPCPCGNERLCLDDYRSVACDNCNRRGPTCDSESAAVASWNSDVAAPAELKRLREAVREYRLLVHELNKSDGHMSGEFWDRWNDVDALLEETE